MYKRTQEFVFMGILQELMVYNYSIRVGIYGFLKKAYVEN